VSAPQAATRWAKLRDDEMMKAVRILRSSECDGESSCCILLRCDSYTDLFKVQRSRRRYSRGHSGVNATAQLEIQGHKTSRQVIRP
jgi:hypothetical protein